MRKLVSPVLISAVLLIVLTGCSGTQSAVAPSIDPVDIETGSKIVEKTESSRVLWTYQLIYIDPANMDFEIQPVRGIETHFNILTWLENGPCTDCFKITGMTPSGNETLLVDIEITHPFDNPKFTGFDVRGIAMFSGSGLFPVDGISWSDSDLGDGELVNADGYTTLYNFTTEGSGPGGLQGYQEGRFATNLLPNALLNGYKRFVSVPAANPRNSFFAGESVTVQYDVKMPDGPFVLGYAVDASWAPPIVEPVENPNEDFPSWANCPEPWKINAFSTPVDQGLTQIGGSAILTIDVFDWQGSSTLTEPVVECPALYIGVETADFVANRDGYTRYTAMVTNEHLAGVGSYPCLIKVEDTENENAPGWLDLSSYHLFDLDVNEYMYQGVVAKAKYDVEYQYICMPVIFSDNGSFDADGGEIVKFEWDWDNDGIYDEEGEEVEHTWTVPGTYEVQFRVTDTDGETDELDVPLEIEMKNALPTPDATFDPPNPAPDDIVTFDASASHDNDCDGEIVSWEWDFDNDGVYDEEGEIVTHSWAEESIYTVKLQVTDDEGVSHYKNIQIRIFQDHPPTAQARITGGTMKICEFVWLTAEDSHDNDENGSSIMNFEWDFDNDGIFDLEGISQYRPQHIFYTAGPNEVQLRVTDDEGTQDMLDTPLIVNITHQQPVAREDHDEDFLLVGESDRFDGDGSYDPDCGRTDVVGYEWDWENDGIFDDFTEYKYKSWDTPGVYEVQLRVTDEEGATDMLDEPVVMYIVDNNNDFVFNDVTSPWLNGTIYDALPVGGYVLTLNSRSGTLNTLDISNPDRPVYKNSFEIFSDYNFYPEAMIRLGDLLYIRSDYNIAVINISDPLDPFFISEINPVHYNHIMDMCISGDYLYVLDNEDKFRIFNIENPGGEVLVGTHYIDYGSSVECTDDYLYYMGADINNWPKLFAFSLNPDGSLSGDYSTDILNKYGAMRLDGDYIYMSELYDWFHIIDLSNPAEPVVVKLLQDIPFNTRIALVNGYVYLQDGDSSIDTVNIIDIDPPEDADVVGSFELDTLYSYYLDGSTMWSAAANDGVYGLDISDPLNPTVTVHMDSVYNPDQLVSDGEYAYLINSPNEFVIVDINPPEIAQVVSTIDDPGLVDDDWNGMAYVDGYVMWGTCSEYIEPYQFKICDVSDPYNPSIIHTVPLPDRAGKLHYEEGYVYINNNYNSLLILDVDPPESASIVNEVSFIDDLYSYCKVGDYIYCSVDDEIAIVDASTPESAYVHSYVPVEHNPYYTRDMFHNDGYLYCMTNSWGFYAYEIADPFTLVLADQIGYSFRNYFLYEDYVFFRDYNYGILVLDISDPANLVFVAMIDEAGYIKHIQDNIACVTGNYRLNLYEVW